MRPNAGTILFIGPLWLDFVESVAARSWRQPNALFTDEVMTDASHLLREEMDRREFPESALGALDTGVTPQEGIADGGDRFLLLSLTVAGVFYDIRVLLSTAPNAVTPSMCTPSFTD